MLHWVIPHGDRTISPIEICLGKRPNVSLFRVFGCRIYALPSHDRNAKVDVHARRGVFLESESLVRLLLSPVRRQHQQEQQGAPNTNPRLSQQERRLALTAILRDIALDAPDLDRADARADDPTPDQAS